MKTALEICLEHPREIDKYFQDYLVSIGLEPTCELYHRNKYIEDWDYLNLIVHIDINSIKGRAKEISNKIKAIKKEIKSYECIINSTKEIMIYDFYIKEKDFLEYDIIRSILGINKYSL